MKKNYLLFVAVFALFLTACSNEEPPGPNPNSPFDESYVYNVDSIRDIAIALVQLQPTIDVCEEVHAAARKAVAYGLDESYYFAEIFGKGERITKTKETDRRLLSLLNSLPKGDKIKTFFETISESSKYMSNYQIYWPYSENWNGKTLPTISFNRYRTIAVHENIGYRITENGVEEVLVDDAYAKSNPVWIINYNPIPYEEYPDFSNQNWVKTERMPYDEETGFEIPARTIQYCKIYSEDKQERPDYIGSIEDVDLSQETLTLYLSEIYFDEKDSELNSLFTGGSHYIVNVAVSDEEEITDPSRWYQECLDGKRLMRNEVSSIRFVVLRSEMQAGSRWVVDGVISWRWQNYEYSTNLIMLQEYGGILIDVEAQRFDFQFYFDPPVKNQIYEINSFSMGDDIMCREDDKLLCCHRIVRDKNMYEDYFSARNVGGVLGITKGLTPVSWH